MKQKKKDKNKSKIKEKSKFNFDEEYIIGISQPRQNAKSKNVKKQKNPKEKKRTTKIKKGVARFFIILILFATAACFLCLSPIFNVQEIIVENNNLISSDTIISVSQIQMYKNMFLMSNRQAEKRLEKNSYIENAEVTRVFPNKIKIHVNEREEMCLMEFAEGKYAVIDRKGYILDVTSEKKNLPILMGMETNIDQIVNDKKENNRLVESDLRKIDTVDNIIDTSKNYGVYEFITKIDMTETTNVVLTMEKEKKTVYLGNCSQLYARMGHIKTILDSEKGKKGKIYVNGTLQDAPGQRAYFHEDV